MIGVFGDSHDNLVAIEKAVEFFNKKNVDLVIVSGDLVSPIAVEPLKKLKAELKGVFGNNEGDKYNINRKLEEMDAELSDFLEFEYAEKKIAVYHGHNPSILDSMVKSSKYDIIISGHTHTPEVTFEGNTLVVNPGESCGYLTGCKTVALVDVQQMKADIHELK